MINCAVRESRGEESLEEGRMGSSAGLRRPK